MDPIPDLTDPDHGRANARRLADRLRFAVTAEEREAVKSAVMTAITKGKEQADGSYLRVGPRTLAILAGAIEKMNASDMRDVHHLEGQKVSMEHHVPDAATLLARAQAEIFGPPAGGTADDDDAPEHS